MADCPTDLGPPEFREPPAPPRPTPAGAYDLNAMVWYAREIVAGRTVRARVSEGVLVRALAQTVVKLAEDRG